MNTLEVKKTKIDRMARTFTSIKASNDGELPKTIEVLKVGVWRTPYHGDFMITTDDLNQFVDNFKNGVGLVEAGIGAPIDFGHESGEKAAGWMTNLYVFNDTLIADVEWSDAGKEALLGGMYKCFSPEFYPKGRGGWQDPEDYDHYEDNVLVGGGLTNIPLFKGLAPVKASAASEDVLSNEASNVIYIKASEVKETKKMPTLEDVRVKDATALTDEEKDLLAQNKDQLTAEEKIKYGFENAPQANADNGEAEEEAEKVEDNEAAAIAASVKSGESVVIKASEWNHMQKVIASYEQKEAEAFVDTHVARGAIVADQKAKWVDRIMKDESLKEDLAALPNNTILADEKGSDVKANSASAVEIIKEKAAAIIASAKADGKEIDFGTATSQVLKDNADLAEQYNKEVTGKE